MAKKITLARAVAGDQAMNKIGTYKESTGGGTPLKKGEKLRDHPEAHRVSQPRDEEGKFTYNAANAKPLAYGPSRGVTIPPFLKGVKLTFAINKDTVINYNGLTHLAGIDMTAEEFIDSFKEYKLGKGFGEVSKEIIARKRGRKSNLEKDVIANNDEGIIAKNGNQREEIKTVGYRGDKEHFMSKFGEYKGKQKPKGKPVFAKKGSLGTDGDSGDTPPDNPPSNNNNNNNDNGGNNVNEDKGNVNEDKGKNMDFDSESAKNNPKEFFNNNKELVKSVMNTLSDVPGMSAAKAVALIASGKFKNVEELKAYYDNKKKK